MDGDGRADLWVGANGHGPGDERNGLVALYLARDLLADEQVVTHPLSSASARFFGSFEERLAWLAPGSGDLDGDGFDDMVAGGTTFDVQRDVGGNTTELTDAGRAWIISGAKSLVPPVGTVWALIRPGKRSARKSTPLGWRCDASWR